MKSDETSYAPAGSVKQKPCPSSPIPDDFVAPIVDFEEYYEKLPKSQKEPLKVAKDAEDRIADEKEEESLIEAENIKQAANDAHEAAKRRFNDQRRILDIKAKNKKTTIHTDYRESLRKTLPATYCASDDTDITNDKNVPKGQKAIKIAEFHQKLANEELWYLGQVKENQANLSVAQNDWKLAQEQYDAELCKAEATARKEKCDADLKFRTAINKALDDAK